MLNAKIFTNFDKNALTWTRKTKNMYRKKSKNKEKKDKLFNFL